MTKLEIQAIKKMPSNYIKDGTIEAVIDGHVVVMSPALPAIIYDSGKWRKMKTNVTANNQKP
jgi:hypothetical protein